jgi:hypothetical protein
MAHVGDERSLFYLYLRTEIFHAHRERVWSAERILRSFVHIGGHLIHMPAQIVGVERLETKVPRRILSLLYLTLGKLLLVDLDRCLRSKNDFAILERLPVALIDRAIMHHLLI